MRTSSQIWASIQSYEDDASKLKKISSNLKKIGETILNYSKDFTEISDLLFEGYNVGGKQIDEKLVSYAGEYNSYSNEIFSLSQYIDNVELPIINNIIAGERAQYSSALKREKQAKNDKNK